MSVYSRIFAATTKRFSSAASSGRGFPQAAWALPGFLGVSWFIWGALDPEIRKSVGLYWDPDAVLNRVEAERTQRLEAREAAKAASKPAAPEPEEEEEDEEEAVTVKDIEAAVSAAVEQVEVEVIIDSTDDDDDDDEEEEEEEKPKPKKKKIDFSKLTPEEKWQYFAENSINPGDDVSTCYERYFTLRIWYTDINLFLPG